MSEDRKKLDAMIDEALRNLTAGAPREGLREGVMARITATPAQAPNPGVEIFGMRVRSFQLAAVGVVAAFGLIAALVIPALFRHAGPQPPETATATRQPAAAPQAAVGPARPTVPVHQVQAAHAAISPARVQARRPAMQRVASVPQVRATDEDARMPPPVKVDPLSDPRPIVNHAIEITPIEIQPLVIPEIQVPSLDAGGTAKAPGPAK